MADPTEVEDESPAPARNWRKELEDRAKEAEARAAESERKLAFVEAGLTDLNPKQVKALLSAHDGEINAEAIRATADELGFAPPPKAEAEDDPDEQARSRELAELGKHAKADEPESAEQVDINAMSPDELKNWLYSNADQFGTPPVP